MNEYWCVFSLKKQGNTLRTSTKPIRFLIDNLLVFNVKNKKNGQI